MKFSGVKSMDAVSSKEFKQVLALIVSMLKCGKQDEITELLKAATESTEKREKLINIAKSVAINRS